MDVFQGTRTANGVSVKKNGMELNPARSQAVRNHSPCGFEWGYAGSGPAQLALALLLEVTDNETAQRYYQRFKFHSVAKWAQEGWACTSAGINALIRKWWEAGESGPFSEEFPAEDSAEQALSAPTPSQQGGAG